MTKCVWGSGLACVRVSPGSHSHGPKVSRQKLTCMYSTRLRAKVDLWIRRIQMIYCVIDGAIRLKFFQSSINILAVIATRTPKYNP